MALYDGFFDAVQEEDGTYDRAYDSGDFTGYFANVAGSGVCIHNNPDSFKAEFEGGTLYLRPGYLFIQGYWLANRPGDGESDYKGYAVTLPGDMTGSMAVAAHLNLGKKIIEIEVRSVSQAYPDALVLAIVTADSATDTRFNTDICGIIDTAGTLSNKVEWALNYIDNEIESKLAAIEQDIAAQEARLDAKIAEVQAVADSIVPPPIGSIKFSASQDVGEEWLRCDGRFISEAEYPELVAALGKLTPSGDQFQAISSGEIPPQISNGVVYGGRMWVYSYSANKLYGVDVEGSAAVKEIAVTSENQYFMDFVPPSTLSPLALSIVPHNSGTGAELVLAQIIADGSDQAIPNENSFINKFLAFQSEFTGQETSLTVSLSFSSIKKETFRDSYSHEFYYYPEFSRVEFIPLVLPKTISGTETYNCAIGKRKGTNSPGQYSSSGALRWRSGSTQADLFSTPGDDDLEFAPRGSSSPYPLKISGNRKSLENFTLSTFGLALPSMARIFPNAGAYLWGKDIYMIFVGTGIIFSRSLEEGSFGYLDTTSVLGTITQFGYLDYSQSENTLYLLGQDTTNTVKVAKMELNTLYDYANDGAWLPMISSDGVPAYIKATGEEDSGPKVPINVTVVNDSAAYVSVLFNGEELIPGTYTRSAEENGKFSIGIKLLRSAEYGLKLNGSIAIPSGGSASGTPGATKTKEFNTNDYLSSGVTLTVYF